MRRLLLRLGGALVTILLVVTATFVLIHAAPGDPLGLVEDHRLSPEDRARLERFYGLDRPPMERYLSFLGHVFRGDLGLSLRYQRPVLDVLGDAFGPTLLLAGTAIALAFLIGISLGTRAAVRPGGRCAFVVDRVLPVLAAAPPFWLGLLAIWLISWKLDLLPASHMFSAGSEGLDLIDTLRHLVLPCLVLAVPGAAPIARHHAAALADAWRSPSVAAARALGVPEARLLLRTLRSALHPSFALLGLALPTTVGGVVVVEVVFAWPGLGRIHQEALLSRDMPLILGGVLIIGIAVVAGSLLADALSALVDPRWRHENQG